MVSLINFAIFVHNETNEFFKCMKIECFQGDDEKLYQKIAGQFKSSVESQP